MSVPAPHFLLYAEAAPALSSGALCGVAAADRVGGSATMEPTLSGRWRFVLRLPGGETSLDVTDDEPDATPERLELLAVVRGLESLGQPSRVTLLTGSRLLRRGLDFGLAQWRENDWQWERYGRMTPVKNSDLWRRLDRLLNIHSLECKPTRLDTADDLVVPAEPCPRQLTKRGSARVVRFDAAHGHAKQQISNHKLQTNSKSQKKNDRNNAGIFHWIFMFLNLSDAGQRCAAVLALVLGRSRPKKRWRSQKRLAHRLQTRNEES